jgi:hypothetical protein
MEVVALSSSAIAIAQQLMELYWSKVGSKGIKDIDILSTPSPDKLGDLPREQLEALQRRIEELRYQTAEELPLRGTKPADSEKVQLQQIADFNKAKPVAALALAVHPEAVFTDARRRINIVFKFNLAVSIALAIILLGGIGGAVFSALFLKNSIWAIVFGGISAADAVGVYVYKPLTTINEALVGTTRLDTIQLRLNQQLVQCSEYTNLQDRINCQTNVWDAIQRELSALGGVAAGTNKATLSKRK